MVLGGPGVRSDISIDSSSQKEALCLPAVIQRKAVKRFRSVVDGSCDSAGLEGINLILAECEHLGVTIKINCGHAGIAY